MVWKYHFKKSTIAENIYKLLFYIMAVPGGSVAKNQPVDAGDAGDSGSTPGLGRSPGGGTGTPLQYSCLENPKDRTIWQAPFHRITKI